MKKYELVHIYAKGRQEDIINSVSTSFTELPEKGYHYHSFIPCDTDTNGGIRSYFLIFENDIEDESNDF